MVAKTVVERPPIEIVSAVTVPVPILIVSAPVPVPIEMVLVNAPPEPKVSVVPAVFPIFTVVAVVLPIPKMPADATSKPFPAVTAISAPRIDTVPSVVFVIVSPFERRISAVPIVPPISIP